MLLDVIIKVAVSNRTKKYFFEKGYVSIDGFFYVKPNDTNDTNRTKVLCKCDYCGILNTVTWSNYITQINKTNKKIYSCHKCHFNKTRIKFVENYGVDNIQKLDDIKDKIKKTNLEKYGYECVLQSNNVKDKIKKTNLEKYGCEYSISSELVKNKITDSLIERYGVKNVFCSDSQFREDINKKLKSSLSDDFVKYKRIRTCYERYGVNNPMQSDYIKDKTKKTNLEKYGVEYPMQSHFFFKKQQKSSYKTNLYEDIDYQGTYELDFLERYYEKLNIGKIEPIRYKHNDKYHYYHPDFYIPEYNLIVEIKSTYTYNYDLERNQAKYDYSIRAGYNFIFIIDKDYTDFEELL